MHYGDYRTYRHDLERTWLAEHAYDSSMRCAKLLIAKLVDEVRAGGDGADYADRYLTEATIAGVCRSLLDAVTRERQREVVTSAGIRLQSNRVAVRVVGEDGQARQLRFGFDDNMPCAAFLRWHDQCMAQELRDSERNKQAWRIRELIADAPPDMPVKEALAATGHVIDEFFPLHGGCDEASA